MATVTCPHCQSRLDLDIHVHVEATVDHATPPKGSTLSKREVPDAHPADAWTRDAFEKIPAIATGSTS